METIKKHGIFVKRWKISIIWYMNVKIYILYGKNKNCNELWDQMGKCHFRVLHWKKNRKISLFNTIIPFVAYRIYKYKMWCRLENITETEINITNNLKNTLNTFCKVSKRNEIFNGKFEIVKIVKNRMHFVCLFCNSLQMCIKQIQRFITGRFRAIFARKSKILLS